MGSLLKPREVAEALNIAISSVHRLAAKGQLPCIWVGGQRRFRATDIERVIENGTAPAERRGRPRGALAVRR
ncbi:MAG: helix-turn-helix domain-containing protein [candidate division Zixibacteria bacterium]|nr:helix-turn-helix domain-containing protein [candidate division Zixibacteria bacterium]